MTFELRHRLSPPSRLHLVLALATLASAAGAVACGSEGEAVEETDHAAVASGEWKSEADRRDLEVDAYLRRERTNFDWFKNSPLGFSGVPMVLLPVFKHMYPEIWTDYVGLADHPDNYEGGKLKPEADRPHRLPYGLAFEDAAFETEGGPPVRTAFFSCGACHTGRVVVDGKIKHLFGAPNTEADTQLYSQRMIQTAARFFDLDAPANTEEEKEAATKTMEIVRLVAVMAQKDLWAMNPFGISPFGKGVAAWTRATEELAWIALNIKTVIGNLVASAKKARLIYETIPDWNNSYDGAIAGRSQPNNYGPRPGEMDAYGIATGLVALHSLGTPNFYERLGKKLVPTDPGFRFFQVDVEAQIPTTVTGEAHDLARRAALMPVIFGADGDHSREWMATKPAIVDIKSLFRSKDRFHAGWDGNQGSDARVVASGTSAVGDPKMVNTRIHAGMNDFINGLPAPAYPFAVDMDVARKGKVTFTKTCAGCHSEKNAEIYTTQALGVDGNRAEIITETARKGFIQLMRDTCKGERWCLPKERDGVTLITDEKRADNEYYREIRPAGQRGYKADVLHGIWTQAPYLHNGSVPTLWHLLTPRERPAKFVRGNVNYDATNVGFVWDAKPGERSATSANGTYDTMRTHVFDTKLPGQSNGGHEYGADLSKDEKLALIEYLKTL